MCDVIERRANKISEEILSKRIYERNCEFAVKLIKRELPLNEIAEDSELPLEKVKELFAKLKEGTA